uniref:Ig-like domain-containing protein n=1 Tax=Macrostomum lignano TaxID=282301 RepID=A0A1I8F6P9_9PLAT
TGTPASSSRRLIDSRNRRWAARLLATTSRSLTPCRSSFSKAMKAAAAPPQSLQSSRPDRPDSERTLGRRTPSGRCRSTRLNGFPSNRPRRRSEALCGWLLGNLKETRNTRSSNSAKVGPSGGDIRWTWSVESAALDDATVAVASLTTLTAQLDSVALLVLAVTFAAVACCLVQQVEAMPRAAVAELLQSAADSDRARELGDGGATTGGNGDFESEAALKESGQATGVLCHGQPAQIWQEEALSFSLTCCEDPRDGQAETDSAYRIMNGSDVD